MDVQVRLAGTLDLDLLMSNLASARPVFHSEADMQHEVAWAVRSLAPDLSIRLEARPLAGMHLDLLVSHTQSERRTAVELKYLTDLWSGTVAGEQFSLKRQAAQDIRAYDVVKDLVRLESLAGRTGWDGLLLVVSNEQRYWTASGRLAETNASAFRLHEGTVLTGSRIWGPATSAGTRKRREADLVLAGSYECRWLDYSDLPGRRGRFRYLAIPVGATA